MGIRIVGVRGIPEVCRGDVLAAMRPQGILFDVHTPVDVAELLVRALDCRTVALLCAQRTQWASGS